MMKNKLDLLMKIDIDICEKFLSQAGEAEGMKFVFPNLTEELVIKKTKLNRKFLQKTLDFNLEDEGGNMLLLELLDRWVEGEKTKNFPKAPRLRESFYNFLGIRDAVNKNLESCQNTDVFFLKVTTIINANLRLAEIRALESHYKSLKDEEKNLRQISSFYTRSTMCNMILGEINSWLMIFAQVHQLYLDTRNLLMAISSFMLFLEDVDFVKVHTKKTRMEKRFILLIRHELKVKPPISFKLDFPYFYLQLAETEPISFINRYFSSAKHYENCLVQIPDNILRSEIICQVNRAYGWISSPRLRYSEASANAQWDDEKPATKKKKNELRMDFSSDNLNYLKFFIKKESSTKNYANFKNFLEIADFFAKEYLVGTGITINSSAEDILPLFKAYSHVKSDANKTILSNLLIMVYMIIFYRNYANSNCFYTLYKGDGRLRKYYHSMVSPTNCKWMRFAIGFGRYSEDELFNVVEKSLKTKAVSVVEAENFDLAKVAEKVDSSWFKSYEFRSEVRQEKCSLYKLYLLKHVLISVGVLVKGKILKNPTLCQDGYTIKMSSFFNVGVEEFLRYKLDPSSYLSGVRDHEDRMKSKRLMKILTNGINLYEKTENHYGSDFSASGHQLRYLYNGFLKDESYNFINMRGNNVYTDIYSLVKTRFQQRIYDIYHGLPVLSTNACLEITEKNKHLRKELVKLFPTWKDLAEVLAFFERSLLKRSLMTGEYNATLSTFNDYFSQEFIESHGKESYRNHEKEFDELFKDFYVFARNLNSCTSEFRSISAGKGNFSDILLASLESEFRLRLWDNAEVALGVFDREAGDNRVYYNGRSRGGKVRRLSHQITLYSDILNLKDTKQALVPNFVHSLDAAVVRLMICYSSDMSFTTIHDEYWGPIQETFIFKDLVNDVMKRDFIRGPSSKLSDEDLRRLTVLDIRKHPHSSPRIKFFYNYFIILP